jgi:tRNA(Arg) A34 adenosine deaminase TadA
MCPAACYWARLPRLVFGAATYDVATNGFEDLQFYREASKPADRFLREEAASGELHDQAATDPRGWADKLPEPVEPKY